VEDMESMEPVTNVGSVQENQWKLVCSICKVKHGVCVRCSHGMYFTLCLHFTILVRWTICIYTFKLFRISVLQIIFLAHFHFVPPHRISLHHASTAVSSFLRPSHCLFFFPFFNVGLQKQPLNLPLNWKICSNFIGLFNEKPQICCHSGLPEEVILNQVLHGSTKFLLK
jgi:hypothetical protein